METESATETAAAEGPWSAYLLGQRHARKGWASVALLLDTDLAIHYADGYQSVRPTL